MLIGLMNAQKVCAQSSTQKWAGHTPAEVAGATAGSDGALFYLYNVGTGLYLSQYMCRCFGSWYSVPKYEVSNKSYRSYWCL